MHARVTVLRGSAADIEAGVANFRENVAPFAKEVGEGAMLLIDRDTGKAVAITLWQDEEALTASEERANALRSEASQQMGATGEPTVERFEVAVFEI